MRSPGERARARPPEGWTRPIRVARRWEAGLPQRSSGSHRHEPPRNSPPGARRALRRPAEGELPARPRDRGRHDDVPWLRTITFRSPDLVGFEWKPGQDVMLTIPGAQPPARRRYTIRRADPIEGTLDIEVVLHGDGPFARWAAAASAGDRIDGIGPRGAITLRDDTAHHLLVGDESAIAATFAMLEALPLGASATRCSAPRPSRRRSRRCRTPTSCGLRSTRCSTHCASCRCPKAPRHTSMASAPSCARPPTCSSSVGFHRDAITTKAYWRRDQPNAAHGEPAKD